MDQHVHNSSSFDCIFCVQKSHKETVNELHRLRDELRDREDVIKRLRANLGDRFDAELENRLLKDQLKKLEEGVQNVALEDKRRLHEVAMKVDEGAAVSGGSSASAAAVQDLVKKGKNYVVNMPIENLADILSCLDRFSLDHAEFTCPKLRAAVAMLDGQNLRSLGSLRLDVCGERGRLLRGTGLQRGEVGTIVVDGFSDPMTLKNGTTSVTGKLEWDFLDMPKATSLFVGLLRNASVQQLSLNNWASHQFLQALSAAEVVVAVGNMTFDHFSLLATKIPIIRDAMMSINHLETLAFNDAPPSFLTDNFLLAAAHKSVMSISLKWRHFFMRDGVTNRRQVEPAFASERDYPELCDGLLSFLFRDDLDESAEVELRFPAARVPEDICLKLMESAISAVTRYSIDVSFVALNDVDEKPVGFEAYRRLGGGDCVIYEIPEPDFIAELKITTVEKTGASPALWKLVEFRRYQSGAALRPL